MSGPLSNPFMFKSSAVANFYTHQIAKSFKWDSGYLKWTPGSAGNRQVWTFSCWVKKAIQPGNTDVMLLNAGTSGAQSSRFRAYWYGDLLRSSSADANYNVSSGVYRDPSAWMHIVWKLTGGTSYQYVNGVEVSTSSVSGDVAINNNVEHTLGIAGDYGTGGRFKGYIAEVVFIDGTALNPTSFASEKNGVWIPDDVSGLTFGSQGYYLDFADASAPGNDVSGNNNDWTNVNLGTHNQTTDTPTNNFCTINPVYRGDQTDDNKYGTVSKGNLQHEYSSSSDAATPCTHKTPASGKWYFEYVITGGGGTGDYAPGAGIIDPNTYTMNTAGTNPTGGIVYANNVNKVYKGSSVSGTYGGSRGSNNDVMGIAVDMDNGAFYVSKNGTFQTISGGSQGDPTSGASKTGAGATWTPASEFTFGMVPLSNPAGGSQPIIIMNFGQEGTFNNAKTAGGNSDENGYGNFFSAVPSGYLAICTQNLSVVDEIDPAQTDDNYPQKLFGAFTYVGNNDGDRTITTGFQPDKVWIKVRSIVDNHYIQDSSRGFGFSKSLSPNSTGEEGAQGGSPGSTKVDSVSSSNIVVTGPDFTYQSATYVAWLWRANGGTTSTNTQGSVNSTVQADPSGSFSIVKFVGGISSSGTETVGHGLNKAPSFIVNFCYDDLDGGDGNRWVRSDGLTNWNYVLRLNGTHDQIDKSGNGNMSAPTSTVFSINNTDILGAGSQKIISYCFANCEGYIKSGTYVGNGDGSDGTFVYTGFKPAWVMVKKLAANNWRIQDNARDTYNPAFRMLVPNSTAAEDAYTDGTDYNDFLSNGFKVAKGGDAVNWNADGATYLYLAMAHNPFKYATAR